MVAGTVHSFYIKTKDGLKLGAWHILPKEFATKPEPGATEGSHYEYAAASELKKADRVFLYFHGNAGNRATFHRTTFYKMLSGMPGRNHVVAIDYRGFGNSSSAVPTEKSVRIDALSSYDWLISQGVQSSKIFVCGHSLGSGVATDLVYSLSLTKRTKPCGGLIIVSGYASIGDAALGYPMVPLLRPFHGIAFAERWVKRQMNDKWESHVKMRSIKTPILILHGKKDFEIRPWQAQALFLEAVGGRIGQSAFEDEQKNWQLRKTATFDTTSFKQVIHTKLPGEEGDLHSLDDKNAIWLLQVTHGGHNTMGGHQIVNDTIASWLNRI